MTPPGSLPTARHTSGVSRADGYGRETDTLMKAHTYHRHDLYINCAHNGLGAVMPLRK
jgi:hypothetical protein